MPDMGLSAAMLGSGALSAGASIFGGLTQSKAAQNATNAQLGMFNQAKDLASPFINFGSSALSPLSKLITPGADQSATLAQTPGYQFALSQGEKGIANQATMTGLGGNVLRGGGQFAEGLAQGTWSDVVNKLMGAAQIGSSSAASVGNMATTVGGQIGQNIMGAGNAIAGAGMGAAGGLGGALQNLGILNWLNNRGSGGGGNMYGQQSPAQYSNVQTPWPGLNPGG